MYVIIIEDRFFIAGSAIDQEAGYAYSLEEAEKIQNSVQEEFPHHSILIEKYCPLTNRALS